MSERDEEGERLFAHGYLYTVESREYAAPPPPFVYASIWHNQEGGWILTFLCDNPAIECHMGV